MESNPELSPFYQFTNFLLDEDAVLPESQSTVKVTENSYPFTFSTTSLDEESKGASTTNFDENNYEPTRVLLFKKIPSNCTEIDIVNVCRSFGIIYDVYLMKNKNYAFVQFQNIKSAIFCYDAYKKNCAKISGSPIYVFYTGKNEIYKNSSLNKPPSRYLLLVFHNSTELINSLLVSRILGAYGNILNMRVLETNPQAACAELEDFGVAIVAKESLDNKTYGNSFKIQCSYINEKIFNQNTDGKLSFFSLPEVGNNPSSYANFPEKKPVYYSDGYLDQHPEGPTGTSSNSDLDKKTGGKQSNTVMIKNLPKGIVLKQIFRLFGCYGNVTKIKIFFSNPENALVEYQDNSQAMLAKINLNNCPVMDSSIVVTISKSPIIINTPYIPETNKFLADYTDSKEHRYKIAGSKNFKNIAQPSPVLHLSNLNEDLNEDYYQNLFKGCGKIRKSLMLKSDPKTLLIEMESLRDSVEVLINFHNFDINGKFLKVSFSKYQSIKDN